MSEDTDIEGLLKDYRVTPSPDIRESVLARFADTFGIRKPASFWRRPVPLYLVAAQLVVAVGVSLFAGMRIAEHNRGAAPSAGSELHSQPATMCEIQPEPALADLL